MFQLYNEDATNKLLDIPENSIDLTVTSPPYDNLRDYKGYHFPFIQIADQLILVTKPGGVVVWIVNDSLIDGSESGTSFNQALYFMNKGMKLHDTMIWHKPNFSAPSINRYHQTFEYMFIFSKGKPKTFNPICDVKTQFGTCFGRNTKRQVNGIMKELPKGKAREFGMRHNVWNHLTVGQERPGQSNPHPAMFPLKLVKDHIISWSNEGDTVLDPMMGSGTTGVACQQLNRNFIGIEISEEYFILAKERISQYNNLEDFYD